MDPKTTALLVKIVALFGSPNEGERDNAFTKARELLEKHDQSIDDVPDVLTTLGVRASAVVAFMDWARGRDSAAQAAVQAPPGETQRHKETARHQDQAESRADVIARHGSVQAALRPCGWEALLRGSVRNDSTFHAPPHERWTRSVYGYTPDQPDGRARDRALRAMARALPLPTNMRDALAEHVHWERRDRELRLVLGRDGNASGLDLTAQLRHELIRNLLRSELPARGREELEIRLRFWIDEHQEALDRITMDEVTRLAEMAGRDLRSVIARSGGAATGLFAQWVCDVVVPALQLPNHGRTRSNPTFDTMLRNAMRAALTETEPRRPGQARSE